MLGMRLVEKVITRSMTAASVVRARPGGGPSTWSSIRPARCMGAYHIVAPAKPNPRRRPGERAALPPEPAVPSVPRHASQIDADDREWHRPSAGRQLLRPGAGTSRHGDRPPGPPGRRRSGDLAERFLTRVNRWDRNDYHFGMAQDILRSLPGPFDIVYCDIDKAAYPEAWELARDRIRPGGLYICDNVLWSGRVAEPDPEDDRPEWTEAIRRHNGLVSADPDFDACVVPTRDGVLVARRR